MRELRMNVYIETVHAILENECYSRHEFIDYRGVCVFSRRMDYYNYRLRHGSIM